MHSLSPLIFFLLFTEIQTSTMMTTTRSTAITMRTPSQAVIYTMRQGTLPSGQPVAFEGEALLLGTLGVGSEVAPAKPVKLH